MDDFYILNNHNLFKQKYNVTTSIFATEYSIKLLDVIEYIKKLKIEIEKNKYYNLVLMSSYFEEGDDIVFNNLISRKKLNKIARNPSLILTNIYKTSEKLNLECEDLKISDDIFKYLRYINISSYLINNIHKTIMQENITRNISPLYKTECNFHSKSNYEYDFRCKEIFKSFKNRKLNKDSITQIENICYNINNYLRFEHINNNSNFKHYNIVYLDLYKNNISKLESLISEEILNNIDNI